MSKSVLELQKGSIVDEHRRALLFFTALHICLTALHILYGLRTLTDFDNIFKTYCRNLNIQFKVHQE